MTDAFSSRTLLGFDANGHAHAAAALSWSLRGNRENCRASVEKLSQEQRDELMEAACVLIAIAGGHPDFERVA